MIKIKLKYIIVFLCLFLNDLDMRVLDTITCKLGELNQNTILHINNSSYTDVIRQIETT